MQRIAVFLDYANINRAAQDEGYGLDYGHLLAYLHEGRFLIEAYAYVPVNPRNPCARDGEIEALWQAGYLVRNKTGAIAGDSYKCNFDVEMTLEMMRVAHEVRPDILVLASGDADFLPVVLALRGRGIRIEVAAFPANIAKDLMLKASGFIDLNQYYQSSAEFADEPNDQIAEWDGPPSNATPDTVPFEGTY